MTTPVAIIYYLKVYINNLCRDALNALKEDSTKLGIVIFYILLFGKNFAIQYFFSSHVLRESCSGSAKSPRIVKENVDREFVAILQFLNSYFVVML